MATFLLIHGIPGSAAVWEPVAARLRAAHHTVLAPSLVGFDGGPLPGDGDDLLAPSQARHLGTVVASSGPDPLVVAAHDFGGPVAAHVVAAVPERVAAMAVFATNAFPDTPVPFPLATVTWPVVGPVAQRLLFCRSSLAMMVRQGVGHPRLRLDLDRYIGDRRRRAAIATIFAASLRRMEELYAPVEAAFRSVDVPVLVGWGDRDPFFPLAVGRRTAALFPNARFRIYDGAGHFLPEERPDDLARDLCDLAAPIDSAAR
jgi:pimeloyl-ACP methyl ester carboxylesterase